MSILTKLSDKARYPGDPKIIEKGPGSLTGADRAARGLGWFSIALGLSELLLAPRYTRAFGIQGREGLVRLFGARELLHGVLTLSVSKEAGLWSRVGGDALDVVAMATALRSPRANRGRITAALIVLAGAGLADVMAAQAVTERESRTRGSRRTYQDRSGFPQGVDRARGAARGAAVAFSESVQYATRRVPTLMPEESLNDRS
jgi:hypothetical protein